MEHGLCQPLLALCVWGGGGGGGGGMQNEEGNNPLCCGMLALWFMGMGVWLCMQLLLS